LFDEKKTLKGKEKDSLSRTTPWRDKSAGRKNRKPPRYCREKEWRGNDSLYYLFNLHDKKGGERRPQALRAKSRQGKSRGIPVMAEIERLGKRRGVDPFCRRNGSCGRNVPALYSGGQVRREKGAGEKENGGQGQGGERPLRKDR